MSIFMVIEISISLKFFIFENFEKDEKKRNLALAEKGGLVAQIEVLDFFFEFPLEVKGTRQPLPVGEHWKMCCKKITLFFKWRTKLL